MLRSFSQFDPRALVLVGLCGAVSCGQVESDEPPESPLRKDVEESPVEDLGEIPPEPECQNGLLEGTLEPPLELPASVRTLASAPPFYLAEPLGTGTQALVSEFVVALALGTVAPSAVNLELDSIEDFTCGEPKAEFTVGSINVLEGHARVTQADTPSVVAVEAEEAGYTRVEVHGVLRKPNDSACLDGPVEAPFIYTLLIHAEEFAWSVEPREDCSAATTSGRPLPVVVRAHDSAGEVVSPLNIEHPALAVSTSAGVWLKPHDEMTEPTPNQVLAARLAVPNAIPLGAGTVTVALADGSSAVDVQVLASEDLDDFDLGFWLSGINSRGDRPLYDGESYGFWGVDPRIDVRAMWVAREGARLCGAPDTGAFHLSSLTPDVCQVGARTCPIDAPSFSGSLLHESVTIIADGTCTIQVNAPAFADRVGVSKQFTVDLDDDNLPPD